MHRFYEMPLPRVRAIGLPTAAAVCLPALTRKASPGPVSPWLRRLAGRRVVGASPGIVRARCAVSPERWGLLSWCVRRAVFILVGF